MAVVREDTVKVSFDVDHGNLNKIDDSLNKMAQLAQKLAGSGGVGKVSDGLNQAAQQAQKLGNSVRNVDSVTDSLGNLGQEANTSTSKLKSLVSTKFDNLKTSLTDVKGKLTEGQTGSAGLTTALNNVAKMSLSGITSGVKALASHIGTSAVNGAKKLLSGLKSLGKVSLNAVVNGVKKLTSGLGTALKKAGQLATKLASFSVKGLGAALTATTTAVVGFGASAVSAGMDFDSSMSQVAATMGTTVDQIGELRDLALEMGSTTAFTATESAEALNYMALAGYDAETSMSMLPTVLNLAAAGGMDLASASDMITDSQSALGLSLDQTTTLVDQMAAASSSNTSVSQLGEAILTVGGTASYMFGGTEEINTALGIMADNGIKGSEAGTNAYLVKTNSLSDYMPVFSNSYGVRPALILPSTALVDENYNVLA